MNRLDFAGRAAVITGGAAGIGYAVAQRLIASGARVALWDRDAAALAAAKASLGDAAVTSALDVADSAAVDRAAREALAALGSIDVLVCSAGITGPNKFFIDAGERISKTETRGMT
ncbi:MAG: SDR family NAD(P)-dependent oxidoreductase, partial [Casimicrobiaceae bacterium]